MLSTKKAFNAFLTRLLDSISINSANVDAFRTRKFLQMITSH